MSGLFEVIASEDYDGQLARRKAAALARTRADQRFGSFLAKEDEREHRLALVKDELEALVREACEEMGCESEVETLTAAVLSTYALEEEEHRLASTVHEAAPKMCPYHKEVVDISLAQGEPRAGFDAMAQHAWGAQHCQGEYDGACRFKREMVTQEYWDERKERREERRKEREERQQQEQELQQEQAEQAEEAPTEPVAEETNYDGENEVNTVEDQVEHDLDIGAEPAVEAEVPMAMAASTSNPVATGTTNANVTFTLKQAEKEHLKGVDSDKRQRQYEKIKQQCLKDGGSEERCKELAARTVNKQRSEKGETKGSSTREAEAVKTVDLPKGDDNALDGPSPELDKRKWTPENVQPVDAEMEGTPHPTRHQDITQPIEYHGNTPFEDDGRFEQTDAVLEKQDLPAASGDDAGFSTKKNVDNAGQGGTFPNRGQAQPVTSAIDPDKNPIREILESDYDGFVPQAQVEAAIRAARSQ